MQQKMLRILEFDKVKEQLAEHASSALGLEKIAALVPSSDLDEVAVWLEETDEAAAVLRLRGYVPLDGVVDIRSHLKRAAIGGVLSPIELLEVAATAAASRQMKQLIMSLHDEHGGLARLADYADELAEVPALEEDIRRSIDDHGEVLDTASDRLRSLRGQIRAAEARIREKLESIIRSPSAQKRLSDAIITIRNDRYVIPVKQEYRGAYGGIVHDQSASGATLFIEPQVVVELNNALREARAKEKQEIERILRELSAKVAEHDEPLKRAVEALAHFDFLFAKAKYARRLQAAKPAVNNRGYLRFLQARHPLIDQDKAVPNDIVLGGDYTTIVITGPNTGGKTVTLKTVGLLTIMAQAGLFIPAADGSEAAVFRSVFADIGDEQSIEQSLSTFSSHMVNIVDILRHVDEESLVLFDELGAGTDPQEGAALAIAILDEVHGRGARTVATTHYPELKAYGYNRPGVVNASVEFDTETLRPTYKLLIGIPGRSNAFDISRRLGLDERIIERAKVQVSAESHSVENMIASLERSKKQAEEDEARAHSAREEAERLRAEWEQKLEELEDKKAEQLAEAAQKATDIIRAAEREAERIINELRRLQKEKQAEVKEHELIAAKQRLAAAVPVVEKRKKTKKATARHAFQSGDEVKVTSLNQKGYLLEKVSEDEWQVQLGILKMKIHERDLEYIGSAPAKEVTPIATVKGKDAHVSLELDLRGERYEDALVRLEKYIDDAVLAGYPRVSIIHGKGTGALRQGVQQFLKQHRAVKSFRFGAANEGGTGVTVVELK
ncbi:endonuclease MutS2 [Geobacillus thermodenitrificans]|uniref:Endonuclease MutS2 n=2 Tax=Geobacillus thermodenitrificans TaxID=33940 RepID=A0ABY9QBI4_GEOTD|nr:endonuclease MutS2 [Geobacillus thermodenitrificans]NNU85937.1 endonuclease MutS2 [Geobacillus sp. MR]ARP43714.1 Endonuclease MutS2 [Geobacillus thermodenitrificans]MED3716730.1 endonuclease MutS2 [Geobacillus thermodenitrificans]MED3906256.1 endonuclease MutS2 [Geobacillus thermodenitrificans]MED4917901.1 endonuclease MutS2 [Geobacillus thermodenitrificans]